jgi:hypothetical protein
MSADGPHPTDKSTEKQVTKPGDKPPAGAAITSKDDNAIQQRAQIRDAIKSHRITTNPNNPLRIDMGDGEVEQGGRPLPAAKTAEEAPRTSDTDYKPQKTGDHSYALGVNRQEAPDTRTPAEKLQDFMQAAAKRVTDPEGWKAWAQGEISKFSGIGAGLNEAKNETKAAVAAGWKAMTDGTVIEFLSQPNAINAPVFKTVQNAFEAMSKDPEAVNKALEALGKVVMKASEGYSNLPDAEKGKVIGKVMFGMINPEGDIKDAEAALKIGDIIATHVDKAVWDTAAQAMKTAEQAAKSTPELAQQTKQMLLDYLTSKGLKGPALEYAGIPNGYFDGLKPTELAVKDNYLAMSKADDVAGDGPQQKQSGLAPEGIKFKIDESTGRLQRTDLGEIRESYKWPVLNEHFSPDAIRQSQNDSCISAVGKMLSEGRFTEKELIDRLGAPSHIQRLPEVLGSDWTCEKGPTTLAEIGKNGPWAALMRESPEWTKFPKPPHVVVVDGPSPSGNVMIRDPLEGTRYEISVKDFKNAWTGNCAYRK